MGKGDGKVGLFHHFFFLPLLSGLQHGIVQWGDTGLIALQAHAKGLSDLALLKVECALGMADHNTVRVEVNRCAVPSYLLFFGSKTPGACTEKNQKKTKKPVFIFIFLRRQIERNLEGGGAVGGSGHGTLDICCSVSHIFNCVGSLFC